MKNKMLILFVVVSVFFTACSTSGNAATETPEVIPTVIADDTVIAEGRVEPISYADIAFNASGSISEVLVEEGESVTKGQPLIRLGDESDTNYAAAQLELVSAQKAWDDLVNSRDAEFAQTVIDLKDAKEEYDKADDYLTYLQNAKKVPQTQTKVILIQNWKGYEYRYKTQNFKGPAPQDWIIEAENDLALKKSTMDDLQRAYDRLKDGPDKEQVPLVKARLEAANAHVAAAEAAIEHYELRAPFNGELLRLDLTVGETALPMTPIAFVADASHWIVETKDFPEVDVANVALGDFVSMKLDTFPGEEFAGKVTKIDPVGKLYLGDMTYQITVALDEPDPRFLWNMTAIITVSTEKGNNRD